MLVSDNFSSKSIFIETTKKILNLAIAFAIVVCSISIFIFSLRSNNAIAQSSIGTISDWIPVHLYDHGDLKVVIGFNSKTGETKPIGTITHQELTAYMKTYKK